VCTSEQDRYGDGIIGTVRCSLGARNMREWLVADRLASSHRPEYKLKAFTIEMSPTPGPDCLGLISNSDKTGSGQEHDLSYRIMVDAGLTPAALDHCRSRVDSRLWLSQLLPQLGDIDRDPAGLILVGASPSGSR